LVQLWSRHDILVPSHAIDVANLDHSPVATATPVNPSNPVVPSSRQVISLSSHASGRGDTLVATAMEAPTALRDHYTK
jgi:hypothetical protein